MTERQPTRPPCACWWFARCHYTRCVSTGLRVAGASGGCRVRRRTWTSFFTSGNPWYKVYALGQYRTARSEGVGR
eukprot:2329454-Rhodomonas_salina.1